MLPLYEVQLATRHQRLVIECAANSDDEAAEYVSALIQDTGQLRDYNHRILSSRLMNNSESLHPAPCLLRLERKG